MKLVHLLFVNTSVASGTSDVCGKVRQFFQGGITLGVLGVLRTCQNNLVIAELF